ncbi:MAG: sugar transferase (PEP-CTERM system associated) [Oceanicoccus sp.]|jgi:sugar transferase (PEP-CTERM system associated)
MPVAHIRIFNHYLHIPYILLGFLEWLVLMAATYLAFFLRFPEEYGQQGFGDSLLLVRAFVFAIVLHGSTLAMGVLQSYLREGFVSMVVRSVVAYCLLACIFYLFLQAVVDDLYLGDDVLVIAILISLVAVVCLRWCVFHLVDAAMLRRSVVFFGAGHHAASLLAAMQKAPRQLGVKIIGCVPSGNEREVDDAFCLDPITEGNWLKFVEANGISEIVVAPDERRRAEGGDFPLNDLLDCKLSGIAVTGAINFCERETGKVELDLLYPSWMVFSEGFRYSRFRDAAKRVFDLVVSLTMIVLLWPFMLLTIAAVALESGFPVIYRQTRVGIRGSEFELLKFRSMVRDAEKDGKAVWAQKNDSRITRVGLFIRNTRLDELPQLWNVLKGDMSFVGPRPERPEFVSELNESIPFYAERHRVKPGLMGWAQLNYSYGASEEDAAQKLRYDLYYTKNHSLLLDCLIVLKTIEIILLGKGVH